jgi:protein O-GlcNAc transferase
MFRRFRDLLKPGRNHGALSTRTTGMASWAPRSPTAAAADAASTLPAQDGLWSDQTFDRAQSLQQQGQLEGAISLYGAVIERMPDRAEAYYKRANALNGLGRLEEALADYDRAIHLDPAHARALCNRGSVLERLGRREEALASCDRAIAIDAGDSLAHYNRGSVLKDLGRLRDAVASYDLAVGIDGRFAEAYINRGNALRELQQHEAAIESFDQAITLKPTIPEAHRGRGLSLQELRRFDAAIASFDTALDLAPAEKFLRGMRLVAKLHLCRWDGLGEDLESVIRGTSEGKPTCVPFTFVAVTDSPALQRSASTIWAQDQIGDGADRHGDLEERAPRSQTYSSDSEPGRLRIGYFSADFRTHPVAYLTAGLFEHHDRSRFEVTGFAFGPEANDAMSARLAKAFDRFVDVRYRSDGEIVELARHLGIDIAVDLTGFTAHSRVKIFALRAAPIQVNFLGYPGTMGADFMDYLVADRTVVPRAQQRHYAEKIAYLPDSFVPFDSSYAIAERVFRREELGLPPEGVVFCCFNGSYKILPQVFDRWMRILSRTGGSVLWLQGADAEVRGNLHREAQRRGVDAERLIFAPRMESLPEHLARLRAADLFLDTFPYNAHSTAMDALWAGVPVLTYSGESFASRVAASLLRTAGLPELIAASPSEYEERAVGLAAAPRLLGELRERLARTGGRLFDTGRYTRNLEALYEAIYERHRSGSPPAHINEYLAE